MKTKQNMSRIAQTLCKVEHFFVEPLTGGKEVPKHGHNAADLLLLYKIQFPIAHSSPKKGQLTRTHSIVIITQTLNTAVLA